MKLRKDITKLIYYMEKPVIGILQAHNLITRKSKKLDTAELTPEAKVIIGDDDELITDEWINQWRSLWPSGMRGDKAIIRKKLNRFLQEEDVELDTIVRVTERYLASQSEPKYAGNANYFFYKETKDGVVSRCKQWLEEETMNPTPNLYGDEIV